jgi:hypothetical protein
MKSTILARYRRYNFVEFFRRYRVEILWNSPCRDGSYSIHCKVTGNKNLNALLFLALRANFEVRVYTLSHKPNTTPKIVYHLMINPDALENLKYHGLEEITIGN